MLDVSIDFPPEGRITEAHAQTVDRQLVQQLGRGYPLQVVSVEPKPLDHRIPHRRRLIVNDLAELASGGGFLILAEGILEQRAEEPSAKEGAA